MGALDTSVRQGKALYAGISSCSAEKTREAAAIMSELGTPLLIHQPSYSMLNRWIEPDLLDAVGELGVGCIVFSPLAQGMLTDKYLHGIPEGSRADRPYSLSTDPRVTSALVGASSLAQLEDNVAALQNLELSGDELEEIDRYATDSSINIWSTSSQV